MRKLAKICSVEDCSGVVFARGLCQKHYRRWQRYGDINVVKKAPNGTYDPICKVDGCNEKTRSKGMCYKHARRMRANGTLEVKEIKDPKRFCKVLGCMGKYYALGLCRKHYRPLEYAKKKSKANEKIGVQSVG